MTASPMAVELNFRELGAGPAVLFIHGWGMSLEVWDRQMYALGDHFRVIGVDVRGHGSSPKPASGYDYDDHASDIIALIERLGLDEVTLVGWSMGGGIATRTAARCGKVNKLVLVGAPPKFQASEDFPQGLSVAACQAHHHSVLHERENAMWASVVGTFHRDLGPHVYDWLYQLSVRGPTGSVLRCYEGVLRADVRPDLRALDIPILVLHGVYDIYISIEAARWVAANIANARLVEFESSGHAPFLEETARFNQALLDFLLEPG